MTYEEAVKKVKASKISQPYLLIKLDYNRKLILPYKEGITFIGTLEKAEQLVEEYSKPSRIIPLDSNALEVTILSQEMYERIKIAALLNIRVEDLAQYEEPVPF